MLFMRVMDSFQERIHKKYLKHVKNSTYLLPLAALSIAEHWDFWIDVLSFICFFLIESNSFCCFFVAFWKTLLSRRTFIVIGSHFTSSIVTNISKLVTKIFLKLLSLTIKLNSGSKAVSNTNFLMNHKLSNNARQSA